MHRETKTLTAPELVELQIMAKLDELTRAAHRDMSKSRARGTTADRFALALAEHWLKARTSRLLGERASV
jgi:hypothetical protein